jgi:type VI secretion system secreted protein VgrG
VPDESYSQDNRLMAIDTPLGKDVLLLQELTGYEGISRLLSYELDLLAFENDAIDFTQLVGQRVSITIHLPDGTPRYINGMVSRFTQGETDDRLFTHYHAEVVPWLWFLTRKSDCRIFQNMTAPDVIKQVLSDYSPDFRASLNGHYPTLEYCVQYRETMFNFVSRLMEEFGIFYYFDHSTEGQHTMVLVDQNSTLTPCPSSPVSYDTQVGGLTDPEVISNWHVGQEVRTGKYTLTDYNFKTPSLDLGSNMPTIVKLGASSGLELYDYPGPHTTKEEGDAATKLRMQEEEAAHMVISAAGNCRGLMSGYTFELQNHYRKDQNTKFGVTEVRHFASAGQTYTAAGPTGGETYSNTLTCIPATVQYRPARITPKPFVQGPQPAIVVGKSGEEIWVDKYGRVIVQFYWDRLGSNDEKSSCWIRTSQPWAGGNWGAMWIPRIGQEVLVSFLEGDPDRPIITGRVYNANQMPPYDLPQYQTRSTFMSRSSKGGGSLNYNELRFEDLKGKEQIFMNAEMDMDLRVEKDSREFIGANRHLIVTTNQQELIKTDKHLHVKGNHLEKVEQDMSLQVVGNQMEKVTGNKSLNVTGDQKESITGNVSLSVTGNQNESVTGSVSLSVTQGKMDSITLGYAMSALSIHLSAEAGIVIECPVGITLSSGANSIDIGPAGVFVTGTPFVFLNSGSSPASSSDPSAGSPDSPDAPTDPQDPDTADDGSQGTKLN